MTINISRPHFVSFVCNLIIRYSVGCFYIFVVIKENFQPRFSFIYTLLRRFAQGYSTLSKEVGIPIIIYKVIPQKTITPKLFHRLLDETKNVKAIKQSLVGVPALYAMKIECDDKGTLFAATDDMLATCFTLGANGPTHRR